MNKSNRSWRIVVTGFSILIGLLTFSNASLAAVEGLDVSWALGSPIVLSHGSKQNLAEGVFLKDYITEASATSIDLEIIPQGKLRMTLSVFAPNADQGSQKKGYWYVTGKWELVDINAGPTSTVRNQPGKLSGIFTAELTFDPTQQAKPWEATTKVPFSTFTAIAEQGLGQKLTADGSLKFGANHAGSLSLQLKLLPKIN